MFDKVSWSDTPTFHNTLVVGSSPTSSTTHSRYRRIPALEIQGNYDLMWWISVGLGVGAAVIHWAIRERPVPRLAMAT